MVPMRVVHEEGACDPEILKRLYDKPHAGEMDPRWEKLKDWKGDISES